MRFEAAPALAAGAEPFAAAVEALVSPAAALATPSFDSSATRFLFSGRASSVVMLREIFYACFSCEKMGPKNKRSAKLARESNLNAETISVFDF